MKEIILTQVGRNFAHPLEERFVSDAKQKEEMRTPELISKRRKIHLKATPELLQLRLTTARECLDIFQTARANFYVNESAYVLKLSGNNGIPCLQNAQSQVDEKYRPLFEFGEGYLCLFGGLITDAVVASEVTLETDIAQIEKLLTYSLRQNRAAISGGSAGGEFTRLKGPYSAPER